MELEKQPVDEERVYELGHELSELRSKLLLQRLHLIIQVRSTLTPEQMEKLKTFARSE